MRWLVLTVLVLLGALGCKGEDCNVGETRCSLVGVEVCDGAGHWVEISDCRQVSAEQHAPWTCCALTVDSVGTPLHACIPESDCPAVDR
jgi:hypothetical protein